MSVRTIAITDEQLRLIDKAIGHSGPGSLPTSWTQEELAELGELSRLIQEVVVMPEDRHLLHGFCL